MTVNSQLDMQGLHAHLEGERTIMESWVGKTIEGESAVVEAEHADLSRIQGRQAVNDHGFVDWLEFMPCQSDLHLLPIDSVKCGLHIQSCVQ